MLKSVRSDLALLGLAVVGVLAQLACVLTGHPVPDVFSQITLVGLGGAAGIALPARTPDPAAVAPQTQATYPAAQSALPVSQVATAADPYTARGPEGL
jgi:hypothetical protein